MDGARKRAKVVEEAQEATHGVPAPIHEVLVPDHLHGQSTFASHKQVILVEVLPHSSFLEHQLSPFVMQPVILALVQAFGVR